MSSQITRRQTVTEIVAVYQRAAERIREGFAVLAQAEADLNAAFVLDGSGHLYIGDQWHRYPDFKRPDDTLERLKRDTWRYIVERLELSRFLSVARAEELRQTLEKGELPPITVEAVMEFADSYIAALPDILGEAVGEVFEWLRPRGGTRAARLKTNTELEVPRKVIVGYAVERGWGASAYRVSYYSDPQITALENVFSALDGRGQITRSHRSDLANAINLCGADGRGETRYFRFRCCKNRNLHIEFKRLDLLARLNAIAGGKRLRPAAA